MIEKKPGEKNKFYSSSLMKGFLGWNEKKNDKRKDLKMNKRSWMLQPVSRWFVHVSEEQKKYPK